MEMPCVISIVLTFVAASDVSRETCRGIQGVGTGLAGLRRMISGQNTERSLRARSAPTSHVRKATLVAPMTISRTCLHFFTRMVVVEFVGQFSSSCV